VYDRILKQMRDKVRLRQYLMTVHAEEEMDEDGLSIFDVESGILTGMIVERQRDRSKQEWKYLVQGETVDGNRVIVVVNKFGYAGKLVILTVYVEA
jgi:arginyl-tRNA--protein-N-Asp/Glu arginylyltransferase